MAFVTAPHASPADQTSAAPRPRQALRFLTAGSVDDGKSTLIGRLLLDSQAILADQLSQLRGPRDDDALDLSLLTDGLEAEREQGITIDVAYRYFAAPRRKFIIADAPGHEQYTRNMVTAASGSDAAVVLVDITKLDWRQEPVALLPQTRRHALLAQHLRVPSVVFAVNKLDAVDDPAGAFAAVRRALLRFAAEAGLAPAGIVPLSALRGDNVARPAALAGYDGPTLLDLLESLPNAADEPSPALAVPVQYVARHDRTETDGANPERVIWGRLASGQVRAGDRVQVFPSGQEAAVLAVRRAGDEVTVATDGQSAGLVLDRHLDVSRGDWIVTPGTARPSRRVEAMLAWLDDDAALPGRKLWVRHAHRWVAARIAQIHHRLDIRTLAPEPADRVAVNELAVVTLELQQPLPLQPYARSRTGGALIVVDPATHRTSGALMVRQLLDSTPGDAP
jgi:sulfate adenylyltransferase subunit 1